MKAKEIRIRALDSLEPPTVAEMDYIMDDESLVFGNIQVLLLLHTTLADLKLLRL